MGFAGEPPWLADLLRKRVTALYGDIRTLPGEFELTPDQEDQLLGAAAPWLCRVIRWAINTGPTRTGRIGLRAWSAPQDGRHSLQIEINRRLYMNEETFEKTEGFDRLQANLRALIETLADFARQRLK